MRIRHRQVAGLACSRMQRILEIQWFQVARDKAGGIGIGDILGQDILALV